MNSSVVVWGPEALDARKRAIQELRRRRIETQSAEHDPSDTEWVRLPRHLDSFKVVFLGDSGVGKTTLARLFHDRRLFSSPSTTVGFDCFTRQIELQRLSVVVKMNLWDTAGHERFRSTLLPNYYRNLSGAIFVYDVTQAKSFRRVGAWLEELKQHCSLDKVKMALIGNKTDAGCERRAISAREGRDFAIKNCMAFSELSAMEMDGLAVFEEVLQDLVEAMFLLKELALEPRDKNGRQDQQQQQEGGISGDSDEWVHVSNAINCSDRSMAPGFPLASSSLCPGSKQAQCQC